MRNHFETSDKKFCVIQAARDYERFAKNRMFGAQSSDLLFVWENGKPLRREQVQAVIEAAAVEEGSGPKDFGSHSLRFGGASALFNAFKDASLVQRWGRWSSNCFQGYIWEARKAAKGVSERMMNADFTLTGEQTPWQAEVESADVQDVRRRSCVPEPERRSTVRFQTSAGTAGFQ